MVRRCRTADLDIVTTGNFGATGHLAWNFEVRNHSTTACQLFGYFGFALAGTDGGVRLAAERSTSFYTAHTGPPALVGLSPGTPTIAPPPPNQMQAGAVAGHGYFAAGASDVCDSGPPAGDTGRSGDRFQFIAPDDTQAQLLPVGSGQAVHVCGLQVTPVQATPISP